MIKQVKCNKCGYVGPIDDFRKGRDFFQNAYVAGCPKCDNRQSPGDASMRALGGARPFVFVERAEELVPKGSTPAEVWPTVLHRAEEAS